MNNPRFRPFLYAAAALATIWLLTWSGYTIALHLKITPEKLRAYVNSVDLSKLSPEERRKAIHRLAMMLNNLSMEDRQHWRKDAEWKDLFSAMTEEEKGQFIDETMPTGFKQMLDSFAQLPDNKRKKIIDDAMKHMKEAEANDAANGNGTGNGGPNNTGALVAGDDKGTNQPPPLSPELEQKVRNIGLNSFYSQSSAETKAELAPLVEEMQHQLQSGRFH